jgi:hypothetical protein
MLAKDRTGSGYPKLDADPNNEYAMIDSTMARGLQHGAGAVKKGNESVGRSKGELTTKINATVDTLRNQPASLSLLAMPMISTAPIYCFPTSMPNRDSRQGLQMPIGGESRRCNKAQKRRSFAPVPITKKRASV